ncbi:MAG: putative TIM-barrel fold metal-dependent hydrolase [Candidatus Latescibacterota bacterium]|jgi:predicted TIM-barrel fold metal-dependent hydrolase
MPVVDSHMHVNYHGLDAAAVVGEMDDFGIDRAWILTWYLPPSENVPSANSGFSPLNKRADGTHAGVILRDVVDACAAFPERLVAGYCPCPSEENAPDLFEAAYRTHGVRVCGEWSYRMLLDDPRSIELFRKAGTLGCPVVLHLDVPYLPDAKGTQVYQPHWYGGMPGPLERALQACPQTIFIGHAPGFWRYISGDAEREPETYPRGPIEPGGELIRLLDTYGNLYADLSAGSGLGALRRDREHGRSFLLRYADRILYGRDAPGNDLQGFLKQMDLPEEVLSKIFSLNALRLVPLYSK